MTNDELEGALLECVREALGDTTQTLKKQTEKLRIRMEADPALMADFLAIDKELGKDLESAIEARTKVAEDMIFAGMLGVLCGTYEAMKQDQPPGVSTDSIFNNYYRSASTLVLETGIVPPKTGETVH